MAGYSCFIENILLKITFVALLLTSSPDCGQVEICSRLIFRPALLSQMHLLGAFLFVYLSWNFKIQALRKKST